tara:strand:+ start:124 stop:603 length:480 start_codon:yes stop_codon:yes gene_type:complete
MNKNIEDMISDYIEDNISENEKNIIENHIEENLDFKLKVKGIKNILSSLREAPTLSPSNDFLLNLENRINKEKHPAFNSSWFSDKFTSLINESFSYNLKMTITFVSFSGLLLIVMLNNFSVQKEVAIEKNINTESLVKAEIVDSLKNNDFSIKQVKSTK